MKISRSLMSPHHLAHLLGLQNTGGFVCEEEKCILKFWYFLLRHEISHYFGGELGHKLTGDCLAAVSEVSYGLHGTLCCETLNQCAELVDKRDKYIRYIKSMYLVDFMFLTFHTLFSPWKAHNCAALSTTLGCGRWTECAVWQVSRAGRRYSS